MGGTIKLAELNISSIKSEPILSVSVAVCAPVPDIVPPGAPVYIVVQIISAFD